MRQSAIGDCVLTLPLAGALRKIYPQAEISWLVESAAAPLLYDHPWLTELVVVPKGWLKRPGAIWDLRRKLRNRFDLVLDPQSLIKSALAVYLTGAEQRIGFAPPQGREKSHWFYHHAIQCKSTHIVDKHLELLRPLGINEAQPEFCFPAFYDEHEQVGQVLRENGLNAQPWYLIFGGASWPSKRWQDDHFAATAHHVAKERGWRALVAWGTAEEEQVAHAIANASGGSATVAPRLTLPQYQVLAKQASFYLGADTGPMHIAAASGVPCIGLFGPTQPEKCGPYGEGHRVIQSYYQEGTTRERKLANNDAMRAITVDDVTGNCLELIDQLLASRSAHRVAG